MTATALLAKYDVPGPRYTSYPTVPYWERPPTEAEWLTHLAQALERGRAAGQGAAMYVHVPFCRSLCHYCGCNTFITRDPGVVDPYVAQLRREWGLYVERLGRVRLSELHLGGGTPTHLTPAQLEHLVAGLLAHVDLTDDAELGVEADPRVTTPAQLQALAKWGFTRLSLGIQDFDPAVQHAVNRTQTVEQVRALTLEARALGFTSINYDLIYGLPKQTPDSVRATIEQVRALSPDRLAFYGYAHVPWMKSFQRKFADADVPAGAEKRALYETGRALLLDAGYREIGLDHFALERDGLWQSYAARRLHRNFMGYTEHETMPLFALGVSAIGDTWTAFAQNEKTVADYSRALDEGRLPLAKGHVLDAEDLALRRHILEVMTRFETRWGPESAAHVAAVPGRLAELVHDGLVTLEGDAVQVTAAGRAFVRNICMAFDARLARRQPDRPLFSQTV